jgi:hypothetical protein
VIGIWSTHASTFLYVAGVGVIVALAPMVLWPLRWAKVIGWNVPADNHLAVYYGRCLGSVACAVGAFAIVASPNPANVAFYFPLLLTAWIAMVAVHVYGAIRKIQPMSETYEIAFWVGLAVLTILFWPTAA